MVGVKVSDPASPRYRRERHELWTDRQSRWRAEVLAAIDEMNSAALQKELADTSGTLIPGPLERRFLGEMAARGWNALTWPGTYGGQGQTAVEQLILLDELLYHGLPKLHISVTSLAPTIIAHGTEHNRKLWLDGLGSGEIVFALGYSEPDAGTDLANMTTKATRVRGGWVVNGRKLWNSYGHVCTHQWLAARTDSSVSAHRGTTIFGLDMAADGVAVNPIWTWGDVRTNELVLDDVFVPDSHVIGEPGRGWFYIVKALEFERVSMGATGELLRAFDDLVDHCSTASDDAPPAVSRPYVETGLAELLAELETIRLQSLRTAELIDQGLSPTAPASGQKVLATEFRAKLARFALDIMGAHGQLRPDDPAAPLHGLFERMYRRAPYLRFGGGTNEVMRDIIAQQELGLPRRARGTAR